VFRGSATPWIAKVYVGMAAFSRPAERSEAFAAN